MGLISGQKYTSQTDSNKIPKDQKNSMTTKPNPLDFCVKNSVSKLNTT